MDELGLIPYIRSINQHLFKAHLIVNMVAEGPLAGQRKSMSMSVFPSLMPAIHSSPTYFPSALAVHIRIFQSHQST